MLEGEEAKENILGPAHPKGPEALEGMLTPVPSSKQTK